jgi:hypothetical protein
MMASDVKLTGPQLRALRILGAAQARDGVGWVRESNRTDEDEPCISWQSAKGLKALIEGRWYRTDQQWRIRSKGRQVLAEHETGDA